LKNGQTLKGTGFSPYINGVMKVGLYRLRKNP